MAKISFLNAIFKLLTRQNSFLTQYFFKSNSLHCPFCKIWCHLEPLQRTDSLNVAHHFECVHVQSLSDTNDSIRFAMIRF